MTKPKERMSIKEERETARSLRKSLDSAHQGLATLLKSLQVSGFQEAGASYRQMQLVLIQQRLWAQEYRRSELNPQWRQIAETATEIYSLLVPLVEAMAELQAIDHIEATTADSSSNGTSESAEANQPVADKLIEALLNETQLSRIKFAEQLDGAETRDGSRLQEFVELGLLERRGWGRSESYRLTEASRNQIAAAMTDLVEQSRNAVEN